MENGSELLFGGEGGGQLAPPGGGGGGQNPGGGGQGNRPGGGQGGGVNLQGGQGLVPNGIDHISYDPTDNSLVVRGTEEAIAELQRNIALFDVAPRQVVIKVEFITTSQSVSRSLGFDFLFQRGTLFAGNRPGSFARVGDPIFINFATGNVTTRLRALLSEGQGKAVQAPVIRTLNNQPAIVQQQINSTIFVNQIISAGNGQIIVVPTPLALNITTGVAVAPRINDDDTITMFLQPTVQDFGQLRRGPNGEEIPDQLIQSISVVARVRDGETIALGGLNRKQETGSTSRFPILGDLPVIGQFFRASTREVNNQELIIFVTPTIVRDDETIGGGGL
jgi:general secretion pathway protein D